LREIYFKPTFNKWENKDCGGLHVIVTNREQFASYRVYITILRCIRILYPKAFEWKHPPYEYEYVKLPIDILAGDIRIRQIIDGELAYTQLDSILEECSADFTKKREKYLLYE